MYDRWVYHCIPDVGIWASLGKAGIRKSPTTLGYMVGLHNCAIADKGLIDKGGIRKSRTTLGEIVGLHCSCRHNAMA